MNSLDCIASEREVVCVDTIEKKAFEMLPCAKETKRSRNKTCSKGSSALELSKECLKVHDEFSKSNCVSEEILSFYKTCSQHSEIKIWIDQHAGCEPGEKRVVIPPSAPAQCQFLSSIRNTYTCLEPMTAVKLSRFCPKQIEKDKLCEGKTKIIDEIYSESILTCKHAISKMEKVRCLNPEASEFWSQNCAKDKRHFLYLDQDFCQSGYAIVGDNYTEETQSICDQLAHHDSQTRCVSVDIFEQSKSACMYSLSNSAHCSSKEVLVLDTAHSSCFEELDRSNKVIHAIKDCNINPNLDFEKLTQLKTVFKVLLKSFGEFEVSDTDHISQAISVVNSSSELSSSEKAILRSLLIQAHYKSFLKDKKWKGVGTIKHLLDHQNDWHTRAQILHEYVNVVGVKKHELGKLQEELLLAINANSHSNIVLLTAPGLSKVNACDYTAEIISGAYPRTEKCLRAFPYDGTLITACEIENKLKLKKLTSKEKQPLIDPKNAFTNIEYTLKNLGDFIYCNHAHCATFVIEEDTPYIFDGTITSGKIEKDKYIRRIRVKNNPGVLEYHRKQMAHKSARIYILPKSADK